MFHSSSLRAEMTDSTATFGPLSVQNHVIDLANEYIILMHFLNFNTFERLLDFRNVHQVSYR